MIRYLPFLIYVAAGIGFVALSGKAEGFTSTRNLLGFLLIPAVIHALYILVLFTRSLFSEAVKFKRSHFISLLGIFVYIAAEFIGFRIDQRAMDASKRIGDEILTEVAYYVDTNGKCPQSLNMIEKYQTDSPKPAYRNSQFDYSVSDDGECTIGFAAESFIYCRRSVNKPDWFCDD